MILTESRTREEARLLLVAHLMHRAICYISKAPSTEECELAIAALEKGSIDAATEATLAKEMEALHYLRRTSTHYKPAIERVRANFNCWVEIARRSPQPLFGTKKTRSEGVPTS